MIPESMSALLGAELSGLLEAALSEVDGADGLVKAAQGNLEELKNSYDEKAQRSQKRMALKLALGDKAHDPEDIISRIDLDALDLDVNGSLDEGVEELIGALRADKPYLFKAQDSQPPAPVIHGACPAPIWPTAVPDAGEIMQLRLDEARQGGDNSAAVQIIAEAANQGITLR